MSDKAPTWENTVNIISSHQNSRLKHRAFPFRTTLESTKTCKYRIYALKDYQQNSYYLLSR